MANKLLVGRLQKITQQLRILIIWIHVRILGTDSTSFTYGWVRNGFLFGRNADILWLEYTYGSSNNFCISKNRDTFGLEVVPVPLFSFSQKKLWRSTVVKFQHSVWPTILSTAKNISLPFPRSEQVFFTISIFAKATIKATLSGHTVCMKYLTIISGQLHLLHKFKSDFAHLLGV